MLHKKGLNPLIQPSFIISGIYKEYKATITFEPETKEECVTILKTLKANMYWTINKERNFKAINKKTICNNDETKLCPYIFRFNKCLEYREENKLDYVIKDNKNLYLITIKLPFLIGHYEISVLRDYKNQIINKTSRLIISNPHINNKFQRIKYWSPSLHNDYKLYSANVFLNIFELLELNNIPTIDDLLKNNNYITLKNKPFMLERFIKHNNKFKDFKIDIYPNCGTTDWIFLNTSKGSLYIDVEAFLNQDFKSIIKKHIYYWTKCYKVNKASLIEKLKILQTEEAQAFFETIKKGF